MTPRRDGAVRLPGLVMVALMVTLTAGLGGCAQPTGISVQNVQSDSVSVAVSVVHIASGRIVLEHQQLVPVDGTEHGFGSFRPDADAGYRVNVTAGNLTGSRERDPWGSSVFGISVLVRDERIEISFGRS